MMNAISTFILILLIVVPVYALEQLDIKGIEIELPHEEQIMHGKLVLSSRPVGAKVYINGNYEGTTPMEKSVLPGTYEVEMKKMNYGKVVRDVYVQSGKTVNQIFRLPSRWHAIVGGILLITGIFGAIIIMNEF